MLTGRLSTPPSKPIQFICEIGAMARTKCRPSLRCPPHVTIPFPAFFYEWREHADGGGRRRDEQGRVTTVSDGATWSTPYVGTVDLEWGLGPLNGHGYHGNDHSTTTPTLPKHRSLSDPPGAFRLARKGQLQLLIKNPSRTVVKVFLVPYDLRTMEPWTRVVLRQKIYARDRQQQGGDGDSAGGDGNLCYALHLQFLCVPSTLAASNVLPAADNDDADAMDDVDSPLSPASTVDSSNNDQLPSSATPRPATHRYYLYKSIRVVFSHRVPDGKEKLKVVTEQVAADVMKHTPTTSHNLAAVDTADEDDHDEDDRFGFGTLR